MAIPVQNLPKPGLVGPLFRWELLRLARRGQDNRARFLLAFALFVILTLFSMLWFRGLGAYELFFGSAMSMSIQESASFGEWFSMTFLYGQLGVLCLLTPAYAAGGIAEEKDRKTLIYLLVSDLSDREIVFGKFLGRTVFLLGVLFAGLPIMAMTQLHGGTSPKFLLYAYLITASTVVLLSAVSAAAACQAQTYRGGLFRAYFLMAVVVLAGCGVPFLNPFFVFNYIKDAEASRTWAMAVWGWGYAGAQLFIAALALWVAVLATRRMRTKITREAPKAPPWVLERYRDEDAAKAVLQNAAAERIAREATEKAERERSAQLLVLSRNVPANQSATGRPKARRVMQTATVLPALLPAPPVIAAAANKRHWGRETESKYRDPGLHAAKTTVAKPRLGNGDPFFWKERFTNGKSQNEDDDTMRGIGRLLAGVSAVFVVLALLYAIMSTITQAQAETGGSVAKTLLLLLGSVGFFAMLLLIGLAGCSTISRERQRLTLESLLVIPEPRVAMLWPKWWVSLMQGIWFAPSVLLLVGGLGLGASPTVLLPALVALPAAIPAATSFALWLSTRCQTVNKAILWYLPVAAFLAISPLIVGTWVSSTNWPFWCVLLLGLGAINIAAAWVFWRLAAKAFDTETILGAGRK